MIAYQDRADADEAIRMLNDSDFKGMNVTITEIVSLISSSLNGARLMLPVLDRVVAMIELPHDETMTVIRDATTDEIWTDVTIEEIPTVEMTDVMTTVVQTDTARTEMIVVMVILRPAVVVVAEVEVLDEVGHPEERRKSVPAPVLALLLLLLPVLKLLLTVLFGNPNHVCMEVIMTWTLSIESFCSPCVQFLLPFSTLSLSLSDRRPLFSVISHLFSGTWSVFTIWLSRVEMQNVCA